MRGLLFYPVKSAHSLAVRTCNDEVTIREQVREIWYRWLLHLVHDLLVLAVKWLGPSLMLMHWG